MAKFCIRFLGTAVLARLLTPEDFGLVAMTAVITGFIVMFTEAGLASATIQKERISPQEVTSLFWVNAALGLVLALVMVGLARPIAAFYDEPRLEAISALLAISFLFGGCTVQHQALLRRQMRFGALMVIEIAAALAACVLSIWMAWIGFGYWSLVGLAIGTSVGTAVGCWLAVRWRPGRPDRQHLREAMPLLKFGGDVLTFNIVNYFARRADMLLIGWLWGPVALALYDKAYTMLLLPIKQINGPLSGVAIPAMSRARSHPGQQERFFLSTLQLIASISLPMVLAIALFADEVVLLWLGANWIESAGLFRLLAVAAAVGAIMNPVGWYLISAGETRRYRQLGIYNSAAIVAAFILGVRHGAEGVALAYSAVMILLLLPTWYYALRGSGIPLWRVVGSLAPAVTACLPAAAAAWLTHHYLQPTWPHVSWLVGVGVLGAIYAAVLLGAFQRWRFFLNLVRELMPPAKPAP
jgi:O-antigen/teichoic acid export membrane protein